MADISQTWAEAWGESVSQTEQRSGVPSSQWRSSGRPTKALPNGEDIEFWYGEGLRQVEAYEAWMRKSTWRVHTMPDGKPGVEWAATVNFGGVPVQLVVDAIFAVNPIPWMSVTEDELVVCDFKTGKRTPSGMIQLGLYASAIERIHGFRPKWGSYFMTRKGVVEDLVDLSPWGMDYFDYHFSAMQAQLDAGYYPATVGDHCGYCGYAEYCFANNGAKASDYPMITGMEKK